MQPLAVFVNHVGFFILYHLIEGKKSFDIRHVCQVSVEFHITRTCVPRRVEICNGDWNSIPEANKCAVTTQGWWEETWCRSVLF